MMNEEPPRRRRVRRLTEAERTLWGDVTRGVAPLRPSAVPVLEPEAASPPPQRVTKPQRGHVRSAPVVAPVPAPPLAPLGRRMRQRIVRGAHAIVGRLDLHGMTQREAHDALLVFLRAAQSRDAGVVLVITGKGSSVDDHGSGRGVLRRQVPHWLQLPAFRELIVGFEPAHHAHGGEGALYVRVRRRRG